MTARILIVDDEAPVLKGLSDLLRAKGYEPVGAGTGSEGLLKAVAARPDLILLDVMLPGLDGFDVLKELRAQGIATPVIMVTAKGAEIDKVTGFSLGVDDYLVKPFSILELLGRIEAVLRRSWAASPAPIARLRVGSAEVDFLRQEVRRGGNILGLPPRAMALLQVLAQAGGQVVPRETIIDRTWGPGQIINPRTIDNLVVKLRQALEEDPELPRHLLTVPRMGFRLLTD